jgi:hypothetical protein
MNNDNVAAVRNAYAVAERKDLEGWINLFTSDGVFVDNSVGATYRGRALADPVRNYGTAFSNMHRELYRIYADGNVVVVQLALQGAHDGPLQLPFGELPATGKRMARCVRTRRRQDQTLRLLPGGVDHLCSAWGLEQPRRRFESLRIRGCPLQPHQPTMPSSCSAWLFGRHPFESMRRNCLLRRMSQALARVGHRRPSIIRPLSRTAA